MAIAAATGSPASSATPIRTSGSATNPRPKVARSLEVACIAVYHCSTSSGPPVLAASTDWSGGADAGGIGSRTITVARSSRSEEHTSELQSHSDLVCRLLLEKKKKE